MNLKPDDTRGPRTVLWLFALLSIGAAALVYAQSAPGEEWRAPARAGKKTSPVAASTDALAAGKKVYTKECLSCHGSRGLGDGPGTKDMQKKPVSFTSPATAAQSDGELFWMITTGRKPMPTYEKLLTEEQRWQVILYIRSLKEQKTEEKKEKPKAKK